MLRMGRMDRHYHYLLSPRRFGEMTEKKPC